MVRKKSILAAMAQGLAGGGGRRHCRYSDCDGHDGGRDAPFGAESFQCPADTHFFRMGWNSADGHYCRGGDEKGQNPPRAKKLEI